ncbi:MAG: glycosyltransferase, partial [Pseudomonadota bacterium]
MHNAHRPVTMLVANTAWNLANFRQGLIERLIHRRHRVIAVAPADEAMATLSAMGCETVDLPMDQAGRSPLKEAQLFARLIRIVRQVRPNVMLTYTIKPNIYGSVAAALSGVPTVATVTGLGTAFVGGGRLEDLVRPLYRLALKHPRTVFFQNADDLALFEGAGLVRAGRSALVPGSGVNLRRFVPHPLPKGPLRLLFVGRLLAEKGVREFVQAAKIVSAMRPDVEWAILGAHGQGHKAAIGDREIA